MSIDNKIPINRMDKWFSQEDYNLEIEMGREAIEGDLNMVVVLYRVDKGLTQVDELYHEANPDEIRYKQPLELRVVASLAVPENKTYAEGMMRYLQDGVLTFGIYQAQLDELDATLEYGDYIGYSINETTIKYFTVVNDGLKMHDDKHTIMGFKGAYRTVLCAPVDENEFSGL